MHELRLRLRRRLEMEPPDGAGMVGEGFIVLDEVGVDAGARVAIAAVGLAEAAARVGEGARANENNACKLKRFGLYLGHRSFRARLDDRWLLVGGVGSTFATGMRPGS